MNNCISKQLNFKNEKVLTYLPGSAERIELEAELTRMKTSFVDIPVIIVGREIRTGNKGKCIIPHDNKKHIGEYHKAGKEEVKMAIEEALKSKANWEGLHFEERAAIFLKAAELASGP